MEEHIFITKVKKTKRSHDTFVSLVLTLMHFTVTENKKKTTCEPAPSRLVCRTIRCRYVRIIMGTARQNKLVGMAFWQTSQCEHRATHLHTKASLATP